MYNIPLFDLNYGQEELDAVTETIKSKWISMGPKCSELEKKFADMLHVKYACAVTNCTAALHLACIAVGLGAQDEVICPSLTFAATVNCIRYTGAVPVFCDIHGEEDLCINEDLMESLITERTKAIIPMHYGGFACNMDKIMELAKKHHLAVIEDACHGPLSEYKGKKLGSIGDAGCFSFFSNKNISTGEGGMIVTNDERLYEKLKLLRSHGMTTMSYQRAAGHAVSYDIVDVGYNYRIDDIRASLACAQLDKLKADLEKRRQVRSWYEEKLKTLTGLTVPFTGRDEFVSNYIFPVVLKDSTCEKRDALRRKLQERGIQTSVHYPAIHRFSAYSGQKGKLPYTEYVSDNEITLPMYSRLSEQEVTYICESLAQGLNEYT